jgi:hypothetical protein
MVRSKTTCVVAGRKTELGKSGPVLVYRGRCSVPRPGVMNRAEPGSWMSAVCQTPRGLITAWPACSSIRCCRPSTSWMRVWWPESATTTSSPAGWRSQRASRPSPSMTTGRRPGRGPARRLPIGLVTCLGPRCLPSAAECAWRASAGCLRSVIRHDERHERSIRLCAARRRQLVSGPRTGR